MSKLRDSTKLDVLKRVREVRLEAAREDVLRAQKLKDKSNQDLKKMQNQIENIENNMRENSKPGKTFNAQHLQMTRQYLHAQELQLEEKKMEHVNHEKLTEELLTVLQRKTVDVQVIDKAIERHEIDKDKKDRQQQGKIIDELCLQRRGGSGK